MSTHLQRHHPDLSLARNRPSAQMLSAVLLLLCSVPLSLSDPTFQHDDPLTGETLQCSMCCPGKYMSSTPIKCKPCREDHYNELWNYLPRCLYCSTFCTGNMEVESECTNVSDRVCRCKEGFYMTNDFCMRHTECAPGHGVKSKGTSHQNTVCEKCAEGTFSNTSSVLESCVNHQTCASGEVMLVPGSIYHDTVCGTCEGLANGGEMLRTFYAGFLGTHKMPVQKMKRFVTKYIHRSEGEKWPRQRSALIELIRVWPAEATEEQLKQLPMMLRALQLNSLIDKMEKRISEIKQESPNCHLSL